MKRFSVSILMGVCMVLLLFDMVAAKSTSILIIESYHSAYSWDKSYIQGIKENMKGDYEFHTFQMDTKRIPKSEYAKSAQKAWAYYLEVKPSLVFIGDDNALKYLGERFATVETPVVFLGINNNPRAYKVMNATNITGVLERPLLKRSIVEMDKILDMKKILVLFDSGTTSRATFEEVFSGQEKMSVGGIQIEMKLIGAWEDWQKTVTASKNEGYDAMVIGLYHTIQDKAGNHIPAGDVLAWTSENTPIPPFAFWDFTVGSGKAIGGLTLFGKTQGKAAALMALKILNGTPPSKIKVQTGEKGKLLFSKSQLKKYNIELPEGVASKATFVD